MNVEADFGASEMRAVAKARECGGIDVVTARTQQRGYFLPTPTAKPSWMNQHENPFVENLRSHPRRAGKRPSCRRLADSRSAEGIPALRLSARRWQLGRF